MKSLAEQYAESVVDNHLDRIKADKSLSADEKRQVLVTLYDKALSAPHVNQQGLELRPQSAQALQAAESEQDKRIQLLQGSVPIQSRVETLRQKNPNITKEEIEQQPMYKPSKDVLEARRNAELESKGIVTDRALPFDDAKLGFGKSKLDDTKKMLSDSFGKPINVMKEGDDLVYYDPDNKEMVKVNYGWQASAGHAIPAAMDVAGTVIAGKTSPQGAVAGAVVRETLGSGAFTTVGEAIRLGIGKGMGYNDMEWKEIGEQSAKVGATAAAATGAVGGLVSAAKGAWNFFRGGIYTLEEAKKYFKTTEEADQALAEVNKVIKETGGTGKVRATQAKKGDDIVMASHEREAASSQEQGQRFVDRAKADQEGAAEALEGISKPPQMVERGYQTVGDVAQARTGKRIEQGRQIVAKNTKELKQNLDEIKAGTQKGDVGESTADYLQLAKDAEKQAVNKTWDDVGKMGGFDEEARAYNIAIPQGQSTKKLKSQFNRRTSTAQTKTAARGTGDVYVETPTGKTKKPQDLYDLNREISDLKGDLADLRRGRGRGTTREKDLIEVIDAMQKDRAAFLVNNGKKALLDAIEAAEKKTHAYHQTYNRSAVGDLLERTENGVPKIKRKEFVDNMLKRSDEELDNFTDVIGDNLELTDMWREGVADAWRSKAFSPSGKFRAEASKKWIKDNRKTLGYFLTDDAIKKLERSGDLAEKLYATGKTAGGLPKPGMVTRLQQFKRKANEKWGSGALASADPDGLAKFITEGGGNWSTPAGRGVETRLSKIKTVKNMTAEHPAAWRRLQNDYKEAIKRDILDNETGYIDPGKIAKWVNDENSQVVKEMLGAKYLRDLNSINKVIKIINKQENRLVKSQAFKAGIQAARAGVAPPLTKRGRALTAVLTWYNKSAQARLADSLLDERAMRNVAELIEHSANTRIFYEKAASLGYALPNEQPEE